MILYMYIAQGRGRQLPGDQILMSTERPYHFYPFVASFKEISLKSDFIQPPGEKVLMSTETSCHFGHLLLVANHRRQ